MNSKQQLYKLTNTITELSLLLSDRLWKDDSIRDQFILSAYADGIHLAATALEELCEDLPNVDGSDPNPPDQKSDESV